MNKDKAITYADDGVEPDILSLPGSVFPPMRSAFFPQETWSKLLSSTRDLREE
jgi:hypothetical protein